MTTIREVPDDLWNEIEKLIPPRPPRDKGGRPPANDRVLFNGMFYILRTGAAWREMPDKYGPWQTVYDRFAEWKRAKVFEQVWAICLHHYDSTLSIPMKRLVTTFGRKTIENTGLFLNVWCHVWSL